MNNEKMLKNVIKHEQEIPQLRSHLETMVKLSSENESIKLSDELLDNNTFIGGSAGANVTTGSRNIMIGAGANPLNPDDSRKLNIGNNIYGNILSGANYFGGVKEPEAFVHSHAGTASIPCLKLDKGVLLTIKQGGAFEYDGTNLYFTLDDGSRKKITMVDA